MMDDGDVMQDHKLMISYVAGMCGAELFPAGRGKDENPRGGAKMKIRGAVRGGAKKRVNQLIQKFDKSAYIVTGGFVLQYGV